MVFVLGDERAFGAFEQLFRLDVSGALMEPVVLFVQTREDALFAFEHFGGVRLMRVSLWRLGRWRRHAWFLFYASCLALGDFRFEFLFSFGC